MECGVASSLVNFLIAGPRVYTASRAHEFIDLLGQLRVLRLCPESENTYRLKREQEAPMTVRIALLARWKVPAP